MEESRYKSPERVSGKRSYSKVSLSGRLSVSTRNIKSNTSVPTKRRCLRRARGVRFDGSGESNRIESNHTGGLADEGGSRQ